MTGDVARYQMVQNTTEVVSFDPAGNFVFHRANCDLMNGVTLV